MPITELSLAQSGSYSPGTDDAGKVSLRSLSTTSLSHDNLDDNFYNLMAKVNECVTQLNTNTTAIAATTPWSSVTGFPLGVAEVSDNAYTALTASNQLSLGTVATPLALRIGSNGSIELNGYIPPAYPGNDSKFVWKDADGILRMGPATASGGNTAGLDSRVGTIEDIFGISGPVPGLWKSTTDTRLTSIETSLTSAGIGTEDTSDDAAIHPTGWKSLTTPARVRKWEVDGSAVQQPNSSGLTESASLNFGAGTQRVYFYVSSVDAWSETNTLSDDYTVDHPAIPANAKELLVYVRTHESSCGFYDKYEWRHLDAIPTNGWRDYTFIMPVYAIPSVADESNAPGVHTSAPIASDVDHELSSSSISTHFSASNATGHLADYQLGNGGKLNTNPISLEVGKCGLTFVNEPGDGGAHVMAFCDILAYRI